MAPALSSRNQKDLDASKSIEVAANITARYRWFLVGSARRVASMHGELEHAKLTDVQVVNKEGKLEEAIAEVVRAILGE